MAGRLQIDINTVFIEQIDRAAETKSFRFEKPEGYFYLAGQHFFIALPHGSGHLIKHITLSSSPTESFIELTTRMTGSEFKNALDVLKPGDAVKVSEAQGSFTWVPGESSVFIPGGIGVTPVRSICRFAADSGQDINGTIIYANKAPESAAFRDELSLIANKMPAFRIVDVFSEPTADWPGYRGYLDAQIIINECPDFRTSRYYVSGPPAMVAAAREVVGQLKIDPDQVKTEDFIGY